MYDITVTHPQDFLKVLDGFPGFTLDDLFSKAEEICSDYNNYSVQPLGDQGSFNIYQKRWLGRDQRVLTLGRIDDDGTSYVEWEPIRGYHEPVERFARDIVHRGTSKLAAHYRNQFLEIEEDITPEILNRLSEFGEISHLRAVYNKLSQPEYDGSSKFAFINGNLDEAIASTFPKLEEQEEVFLLLSQLGFLARYGWDENT